MSNASIGAAPHITAFFAENIKKLRAVRITPNGAVVQITGPNGSGKSSVLDAIFWALAGTTGIEAVPIRQGEERAVIELSLGPVTVIRRFTPSGSTLTVQSDSGARYPSPQRLLDDLLGTLCFDPLAFERMAPKARLEELRRIAPLPVEVDVLDNENRSAFEARTDLNRRIRDLEGQVAGAPRADAALLATVPSSVDGLLAQMESASETNAAIERRSAEHVRLSRDIGQLQTDATQHREQAARLIAEAEACEVRAGGIMAQLEQRPLLAEPINVASLRQQINVARTTNEQIATERQKLTERTRLTEALEGARRQSEAMTAAMTDRTARRTALIAGAAMPVEGLSYGDGDVLFRGLPFDQASSAERLRVSMAIAMAGQPALRVLRIKDGSLLDSASLQLVAEMAAQHDFQVWLEKVQEGGQVGIEMHDGSVASVDGERVSAEAPRAAVPVDG